jgi:hypothetical protein
VTEAVLVVGSIHPLAARGRPAPLCQGGLSTAPPSNEQRETRARLLNPLVDRPDTGYQYLDYDRTDDAIVIAETTTSSPPFRAHS